MRSLKKTIFTLISLVLALTGSFASLYESTNIGWTTFAGMGVQGFSMTICSLSAAGAICTVDQPGSPIDNKIMWDTRVEAQLGGTTGLLYKLVL